ncbi:MAG: hypothetical protein ABJA66_16020 [Actinomycetota bacterium]
MELVFTNSTMGKSESAVTADGTKITLVHRTKSNVIVYYGQDIIADCRTKQEAIEAVNAHIRSFDAVV